MATRVHPREILKIGPDRLKIVWEDGHASVYDAFLLRRSCPCALCVDEWTGNSKLDAAAVSREIKTERAELVGNYALAFQFSDGHATGIFPFEKLREMCPCPDCSSASERLR